MVQKTQKEESWIPELQSKLKKAFKHLAPNAGVKEQKVLERAIHEIVEGTKFCAQKKLYVSFAVEPDFSLSGSSCCILAKNSPTKNFFRASENLSLSLPESASMGFACSSQIRSLLCDTKLNWNTLYVFLWRVVANYFIEIRASAI